MPKLNWINYLTRRTDKPDVRSVYNELAVLNEMSVSFHGRDFVNFSPLYRDYQSKRRVRLHKTWTALKKGAYVK